MLMQNRRLGYSLVVIAWLLVLAGCGGGGGGAAPAFIAPSAPVAGANPTQPFSMETPNYFTLYTAETAPFSPSLQLADVHYPVPVHVTAAAAGPAGFDLAVENEQAIRLWHQADPRVTIVSHAPNGNERIAVKLVPSISYAGLQNILGLTKLLGTAGNPYFEVLVAANDPITHEPLSTVELQKTLAHELGHAFGLGHSPTQFDLMYFRANAFQGQIPRHFLTFGDAMALWSTLNNRAINYVQRDAVTPWAGAALEQSRAAGEGVVVCVYTKE
ncbi:MAG TPA: matrixin family metalloprotease [Armatimonadota bacterium]|nr:matrixin family metalloprotease [Armatimonadota bacterium]